VSYRDLWARTVAALGLCGLFLALAVTDPIVVIVTLACCYGALVVLLIGVESCDAADPKVEWRPLRWRAGLGACLCVGFPAACAVSTSATLRLTLVLVMCSPPLVARVRRVSARSCSWADAPAGRPHPEALQLSGPSQCEDGARMLEQGPTPGLIASMDTATLCVAWQRSFGMLSAASDVGERALVAHLRQLYLDEFYRRHPNSLDAWLRTLPAASSGPDRFLPDT